MASALAPQAPAVFAVPSVRRRLAAMLYEAVLLFGIVFFAGLAFSLATQQRNGLVHHNLLAAWIALVVGAYFVWFWTHGGQTLPMKTWRLRLESSSGQPLNAGHALVRYALGWLWFLPPLALHPLLGLSVPVTLALAAAWIVAWAGAARLHADRQFPHDRIARTRVVAIPR
ncbi:RDD family protein [Burkholderia diffusa]|uniref:Membrane protein n=2 Tax=Burkholderia diffusa TaxID=488732 RepID=A0A6P2LNY9_9BURK|nr:RDD family protein [Burkholderia diffusa]KAB0649037.1 RDD family protein [Burkholderia diffusa]MBM2655122.1 RDD family protein [Burkholderia diffusa]VWB73606.1 membrane protein [Burkholderia diffusa]